jgi:hypothetical protein
MLPYYTDVQPSFPDLDGYIEKNLGYCPGEICFEGTVWVCCMIAENGCAIDPYVSREAGPEEIKLLVYKFIHQMPAWKPGQVAGRAVKTIVYLPLRF